MTQPIDLRQFESHTAERIIKGTYKPNWVAHYRITKCVSEWFAIKPGHFIDDYENRHDFATFEEARSWVAEQVDIANWGAGWRAYLPDVKVPV